VAEPVELHEPVEPERYVRLLAERTLLDGEVAGPFAGPVERAAAALVAAGVLPEEVAASVEEDYALAGELRGLHRARMRARARGATAARPAPAPLTPATIVVGPFDASVPWGEITVAWVRFGDDRTDFASTGRVRGGRRSMRGPPPGPLTLQVADDRGTSATCNFSGQWDIEVAGTFTSTVPLSRDTAWLEFSGDRVELPAASTPDVALRVEPLPERPAGIAHLWHELAATDPRFRRRDGGTEAALDALLAVGVVAPDDPEVDAFRRVSDAMRTGGGIGPNVLPGVREPWASLLAQGPPAAPTRADGVAGVVPVGVVAALDGVLVAIDVIDAQPEGLSMEVVVSPGTSLNPRFGGASRDALEWWLEDDLGTVRIGHVENCGGGPDAMRASIEFSRGIDAAARELRILPTGTTERAVVTVALPWAGGSSDADAR
jgi:hypothetical protein